MNDADLRMRYHLTLTPARARALREAISRAQIEIMAQWSGQECGADCQSEKRTSRLLDVILRELDTQDHNHGHDRKVSHDEL